MAKEPIPTWFFVLVVVKFQEKYLLVHERKHGQHWYLPAGRVEAGEDFITAAKRETLEEAGIEIKIDGVIRVEHSPYPNMARHRVIFTGSPVGDTTPKSIPDQESLEASWFSLSDLDNLSLRGAEVREMINYVENKRPVYPLSVVTYEGAPY